MPDREVAAFKLGRTRDYMESLSGDLQELQGSRALIAELIQNADDAAGATCMRFEITREALTVWNDAEFLKCEDIGAKSCPLLNMQLTRCDFHSFREVSGASKRDRDETTGAFGIGFTSVYQITDKPLLRSAGWRWEVDEMEEEQNRITSYVDQDTGGTTFVFPWAREQSPMRNEIGQVAVTDALINEIGSVLLSSVADFLLFLRRLDRIEVSIHEEVTVFDRTFDGEITTITRSDGTVNQWYLISDDFTEDAALLKEKAAGVIPSQRSSSVDVAIRLGDPIAIGRYFATLPTEESTCLPLSVNASFFPKRDRKSILVDSSWRGDWNEAIIACAAKIIAARLEVLAKRVGDLWIIQLLTAAHQSAESTDIKPDRDLAEIWRRHIWNALPDSKVVPTISGGLQTIDTARVWSDTSEYEAASTLLKLGIHLVIPDVHKEWFGLRSIGIPINPLHLKDITQAFVKQRNLTPFSDGQLNDRDRESLWMVIDHLLDPSRLRSNDESRSSLDRLALHPLRQGGYGTAIESYRADREAMHLINRGGLQPPVITTIFEDAYPHLARRVREAGVAELVGWFSRAFTGGQVPIEFDRLRLLDLLGIRRQEALQGDHQLMRQLPIYPTGRGFGPLGKETVLPAVGFNEPLSLAAVIDLSGRPAATSSLLEELGVPRLSLKHYCANLLREDVIANLEDTRLLDLLSFLRHNYSLIEEDSEVKQNLRSLQLVPCIDGNRRTGQQVYFDSVDVRVVGSGPPRVSPIARTSELSGLLTWLGVRDKPHPADVLKQCGSLRQPPSNHIEIVEAILGYLDEITLKSLEEDYFRLKNERWLPIRGKAGVAARPVDVYTNFRRNIFSTQASFLHISQSTEQSSTEILQWLGVQTSPPPELVVKHLLKCVEDGVPVKSDVWQFLNDNIEAKELDRISSRRCILLSNGEYVKPNNCYWETNPFGAYRHLLDESFRKWKALFTRLGVRDRPLTQDAIDVLGEVAAKHGGAEEPVLPEDREVILRTWIFLNDLLTQGEANRSDFRELDTIECVLDGRGHLRRPGHVLFRDSSAIAKLFDENATTQLIDRPENIAEALEGAGVRRLRSAVHTEIVERRDSTGPSRLAKIIEARRHVLIRVLRSSTASPGAILAKFESECRVDSLSELVVIERVELNDVILRTKAITRPALLTSDGKRFLVIEPVTRWPEVAKELAFALTAGTGEVSEVVAMLLKTVLAAETAEAASAELDGLGFAEFDEAIEVSNIEIASTFYLDEQPDVNQIDQDHVGTAKLSAPQIPVIESDFGVSPEAQNSERNRESAAEATIPTLGIEKRVAEKSLGSENNAVAQDFEIKNRSRLKSYVTPNDGTSDDTSKKGLTDLRDEIERKSVDAVLAYELRIGRSPKEMPHLNPGYDIESLGQDGDFRVIEVKGTSGRWDDMGVGLTSREFEEALRRGPEFWLYVVEVHDGRQPEIHRIQDPARKIDRYFFDDGWRVVSESAEFEESPLPVVPNQFLVDIGTPRVKMLDWKTGLPTGVLVSIPDQTALSAVTEKCFAIQIAGEALGVGTRGGLAFAVETTDAETDEWVVVRLTEKLDPDTKSTICIRRWSEEATLNQEKRPIRLRSDSAVPPINLDDKELAEVLGRVEFFVGPVLKLA